MEKSGQSYGEIKSPSTLAGPVFCWYRFEPEPGERVEVQVHRIKRIGQRHLESNKCIGGYLQVAIGESLTFRDNELATCGANERYFPPLVQFVDFDWTSNDPKVAMLLFKVEETTSRSQFLAQYSFTKESSEETGLFIKGAQRDQDDDYSKGIVFLLYQ